MTREPHSAAQFTPARDHWWHADFLDLMAKRLDLGACRNVLELGAGKGHWTSLILERIAPDGRITAVERERRWIAAIERRFAGNDRVRALQGDITSLALEPRQYDMVTCQTVLMHLQNVPAVLHDAYDLLAPGGLLLVSEPDNFANRISLTSVVASLTAEQFGQVAAMWWAFEKGRESHGLGEEWIAVRLPALINAAGFTGLKAYHNDRPAMLAPPYTSKEERAAITDWLAAPAHETDVAGREEVLRFVLAGGMDEATFDRAWVILSAVDARSRAALSGRTLSSCTGGNLYLFAARKPAR
ncbi:MAG: methyltransferase domain-containing protein [Hyphomicrobiaceae bacterium]|nr:methyltransferase domain-containing protein [Hyphomicrobiaceae bacterium]